VIAGEQFIILRNDVRHLASNLPPKAIDVLVYLHDLTRREWIRDFLETLQFKVQNPGTFEKEFGVDLARARVFISGFGVSFNEALALQTVPVCWPDSDAHRDDAARFYRHLGMEPLIIDSMANVEGMIVAALNKQSKRPTLLRMERPTLWPR
jgi:hypothetical protein